MALTTPALLQGIDLRYETENRLVWNERERRNEERELVYEISWIPELRRGVTFCGHRGANLLSYHKRMPGVPA